MYNKVIALIIILIIIAIGLLGASWYLFEHTDETALGWGSLAAGLVLGMGSVLFAFYKGEGEKKYSYEVVEDEER